MKRLDRWIAKTLVLCGLLVFPAWGQNTAEVRGRIVDSSDKPVVSAFVVLTAQDTSLMRAASTDDAGAFEFASLPIGNYYLQVKAEAFRRFDANAVRAS